MKNDVSRIMIESVVKKAIKDIKENPRRNIRNLVDMAVQFSPKGQQSGFFSAAQAMLKNENSPYYDMIYKNISLSEEQRILNFGMNVGYNGLFMGADEIRKNERKYGFHIPWIISLEISKDSWSENKQNIIDLIAQGRQLGIYNWILFVDDEIFDIGDIAGLYSDCAFFLFIEGDRISPRLVDCIYEYKNIMPVCSFDEDNTSVYQEMRRQGILFSIYIRYGQCDIQSIINGEMIFPVLQHYPVFTVLVADGDCPQVIRKLAYNEAEQSRIKQKYCTVLWELDCNNRKIDAIVSKSAQGVYFDKNGNLQMWHGTAHKSVFNVFEKGLKTVLKENFAENIR